MYAQRIAMYVCLYSSQLCAQYVGLLTSSVLNAKLLHDSQNTSSGSMPMPCRLVTDCSSDPPVGPPKLLSNIPSNVAQRGGLLHWYACVGVCPL